MRVNIWYFAVDTVHTLASVWRRKPPGHQPVVRTFQLPQQDDLTTDIFVQKYNRVQGQLQEIAGVASRVWTLQLNTYVIQCSFYNFKKKKHLRESWGGRLYVSVIKTWNCEVSKGSGPPDPKDPGIIEYVLYTQTSHFLLYIHVVAATLF